MGADSDQLWTMVLLILGCQVSEDVTLILAGKLAAEGQLTMFNAVLACVVGIFGGDMGLWLIGRIARGRVHAWPRAGAWLASRRVASARDWLDRNLALAVISARFVPGSRLPVYLAAGVLGRRGGAFAFWTLVAALIWTPAVVMASAWFGPKVIAAIESVLGRGLLALLVSVVVLLVCLRLGATVVSRTGRDQLRVSIRRLGHWEFWPAWLAYAPLIMWVAWLSIRYRGFATVTAANPDLPLGGFIGESKYDILQAMKSTYASPTTVIEPHADPAARLMHAQTQIARAGLPWPLVLKPDQGYRGKSVRLIPDVEALRDYLNRHPGRAVAQPFHPGPFEAGIFYCRTPSQPRGRIFSITRKEFPTVTGDGQASLGRLIERHPRYSLQKSVFFDRHADRLHQIPRAGETVTLALSGNHCQGTIFRDGASWITPALEDAIDRIARSMPRFHYGRFDVRFADLDAFRAGRDFTVIELNGVTSESTNVYDPDWPWWRSYQTLMRQWSILFRIGDANRRDGHRTVSDLSLARHVIRFYLSPQLPSEAD